MSSSTPPTYTPTPTDVLSLRQTLLHFVPLELANIIINDAEYWPALTSSRDAFSGPALVSVPSHTKNDLEEREDGKDGWCYLISPAVPRLDETYVKVQRVKFSVEVFYETPEGGCEGESTGANSWLEATILPPSPSSPLPSFPNLEYQYPETSPTPFTPKHPERWFIQSNKSMTSERVYDITWDSDDSGGGFVDSLKSGDRVGVMCRDLYKGWVNCIYTVRVDVFHSV